MEMSSFHQPLILGGYVKFQGKRVNLQVLKGPKVGVMELYWEQDSQNSEPREQQHKCHEITGGSISNLSSLWLPWAKIIPDLK